MIAMGREFFDNLVTEYNEVDIIIKSDKDTVYRSTFNLSSISNDLYNIIYTGITTTPFLHFEDVEGDYCFINTDEILAIEFVKSRNKKIFKPKK